MMAGTVAGLFVAGRHGSTTVPLVVFAAAGAAPDIDLLLGITVHRGPTHSLAAACVAGAIAWLSVGSSAHGGLGVTRLRFALAVAAAYATHTLTDWLAADTTAPMGLMVFWPLTDEYYIGPFPVFLAVSRRYWLVETWLLNVRALIRELLIFGPLVWIAWWVSRKRV